MLSHASMGRVSPRSCGFGVPWLASRRGAEELDSASTELAEVLHPSTKSDVTPGERDMVHLPGQVYCLYSNRQREVVLLPNRDGVLQSSWKSGGVKGEKENKVNLTGVGRDGEARGEDGTRTWSSLISVFIIYILFPCRAQGKGVGWTQ